MLELGDVSIRTSETTVIKTLELRKLRENPAKLLVIRY